MMNEAFSLSGKIKINVESKKIGNFSQNQVRFYLKYSSFVFRVLKKTSFQNFLNWMLKKERIAEQAVSAVHVKVLPLRRNNGKSIAGICDTVRGRIRIYPKTIKFCQAFTQKFGRGSLLKYAGNRARAALIHELLHLKYVEDEKTVRELAREYFYLFTQKQYAPSSHSLRLCTMIFAARLVEAVPSSVSNGLSAELGAACLRASDASK
ncbi:MAG: hypothetical protein NWE94_06680 [Candidatus Bathyarchaeota archaeon]|nr:hypothetical protein [Candidatus Bathyarchaeota archaeon]